MVLNDLTFLRKMDLVAHQEHVIRRRIKVKKYALGASGFNGSS